MELSFHVVCELCIYRYAMGVVCDLAQCRAGMIAVVEDYEGGKELVLCSLHMGVLLPSICRSGVADSVGSNISGFKDFKRINSLLPFKYKGVH